MRILVPRKPARMTQLVDSPAYATPTASGKPRLLARDSPYARPGVEIAPWNAKLMQVTDPFGNRLRFNEDLPPA